MWLLLSQTAKFVKIKSAEAYQKVSKESTYQVFSRLDKEMYVWKQILANRGKWTTAELKESLRYINEIRTEEYDLTPLKIK